LKFIKKTIFAINIILIVSLLLAYLSPYFDPNDYWIFSMFGVFYPVLLFANIAMVLFWMLVDFKYLFASLITILLGWSHLQGFVNFSTLSDEPGVKTPNGKVRIYTAHLQSNQVSKDAVVVLDNANLQEKQTWNGIRGILSKYSNTSRKRAKQAQMIANHAAKCTHKTIIAGDVNDPPTSYTYSRLCGDFQDSFVEAGSGIGTTYAGRIPMLRIDYIFVDEGFTVESFEVLKENYSDHYPVKGVYSFVEE